MATNRPIKYHVLMTDHRVTVYSMGKAGRELNRSDRAAFSYRIELDTGPGPVPINGCYVIPVLACCSATGAEIVLYIV